MLAAVATGSARAGGGSENVLLVVNADSVSSMTLANEYIHLRQVPACNVLYLHLGDLHDQSTIEVSTFRERILRPAFRTIDDRGLTPQIDYIVYSSDVPYAVNVEPDVKAKNLKPHQVITQTAATTGLTFLHRSVLARDPGKYLNLTVNRYARQAGKFNLDAVQLQRHLDTVRQQLRAKQYDKAQELLAELLRALPDNPEIQYTHACLLAGQDKSDDALAALRRAVNRGFNNAIRAENDILLASLREHEEFKPLLDRMKTVKPAAAGTDDTFHTQPTLAFRSSQRWDDKNNPTFQPTGEVYMLSTMLAWTSGRGVSIRQALDVLRRSAAVDGTQPRGTFYFMVNSDVRSTTRKWGFASAAARLKEMGHQAELVEGVLPKDRKDIVGLMAGSANFNFAQSGGRILPGAICEHLTSFGGQLSDGSGQTLCTEFLQHGASGTSGTVTEPYALQTKFPSPFIHVHYARGCSLAEAFYQSVQGPYQLIILGDPLCQPWASIPVVTFDGVEAGETVSGTITIKPATMDASDKIAQWQLFANGKGMAACAPGGTLRLDTLLLPDGLNELRVVCIRDGAIMTQGRTIVSVNVANTQASRGEAALADKRVTFGQSTALAAQAKGAKKIRVTSNGMEIGTIDGDSGTLTVDSAKLGMGKLRLLCEAILTDRPTLKPTERVLLPPLELQVDEPAVGGGVSDEMARRLDQQAKTAADAAESPHGFAMTLGDKTFPVTTSMRDNNWLVANGAVRDKPFALAGYVKVTEAELYQLQVFFIGELSVEVDGQPLACQHSDRGWRHFPVALKPGWHSLKLTATSPNAPAMTLNFGAKGAPRLTAERIVRLPEK